MNALKKQPKIFYGWWILLASTIVMFYMPGLVNQGFTALFEPIQKEFGWSYANVSMGASLRGLEVGLLAPLVGFLVDRWGSRRLIFGAVLILSLGLFSLSRIHSLAAFYWSFVLIAIGMSGCVGTVLLPTVTNWFRKKIGLAIGLMGAGTGFSGFLVPAITWLIDKTDWRTALFYMSLSVLVIGLPVSLLIRHKPQQYGLLPDGVKEIIPAAGNSPIPLTINSEPVITAKMALKTRVFWQLALASSFVSIVTGSLMTHIMPYFTTLGISRTFSASVVLVLSLVSIGGRLGSGWLGDKIDTKKVYVFFLISMIIGTVIFAFLTPGNYLMLGAFILFYSLGAAGNMTLRPVLLRKYFHSGRFGTILGIADMMMMLGQIGVPLAGWWYDTHHNTYTGIWLIYVGIITIGAILLATTPKSLSIPSPETAKQQTTAKQ